VSEDLQFTLAALAVFGGATLQSVTGFGFALVCGPAVFAWVGPAEAIAVLLVLGTLLNVLIMTGEGRESEVRAGETAQVLAWAVPGVATGILILTALTKPTLQVIVGVGVIVAAAVQAGTVRAAPGHATRAATAIAGLAAGALTTTTATAGPPLVLLLERAGARPAEFRDTMAAMLLGLNVLGGAALILSGETIELPSAVSLAALTALAAAGRSVGRRVFDRLREDTFRAVGLVVIVACGLASVAAGA
jgi:uncharacterized protein